MDVAEATSDTVAIIGRPSDKSTRIPPKADFKREIQSSVMFSETGIYTKYHRSKRRNNGNKRIKIKTK